MFKNMFEYFESLPVKTQFILLAIGIALLFLLVRWNTKRNRNKRISRSGRDFGARLKQRKKEQEEKQEAED